MSAHLRSPRKIDLSASSAFHRLSWQVSVVPLFFSPRFWRCSIAFPVRRVMNSLRYHPYLLKCHETMYLLDLPATTDGAPGSSER